MENTIIKRNTFKEAFADVLKMSHGELIAHPIDPFIEEAFNSFEEIDIYHKNVNYEFTFNTYLNTFSSYNIIPYHFENFLSTKKTLLLNKIIHENYVTYMNKCHFIISYANEHISGDSSAKEKNEVEQWLLAA